MGTFAGTDPLWAMTGIRVKPAVFEFQIMMDAASRQA